jgi:hypothetical protein
MRRTHQLIGAVETVTAATKAGSTYAPADWHDPDADSDAGTISINR